MIKTIVAASIVLSVSLTAQAQTPDTLCDAVSDMIKGAAETPPFRTLGSDPRIMERSAQAERPPGMEGAFMCSRLVAPVKRDDGSGFVGFFCMWSSASGGSMPADRIAARVNACLAPSGWTADPPLVEDDGESMQGFSLTGSKVKVATRDKTDSGAHVVQLIVSLPAKR